MKTLIPSTAHAVLIVSTLITASAFATMPSPSIRQPETLPDGNVRDPVPTPDEVNNLLVTTKKNLVFLKSGTFEMGDWGSEVNENGLPFDGTYDSKPLHTVTLSDFQITKFPVTYAEFDVFTAAHRLPRINQSAFAKSYRKPDNPAGVTWQGAKDYCLWLAQLTGQRYDLPTEAQWEYAARSGGMRHIYPTDNGKSEPGRNLPSFEQEKNAGGLVPVSSFPPNKAGVYYMSAGVHEYTNDWYDAQYYEHSPSKDPTGPTSGTYRVLRGHHGNDFSAMTFKRWSDRHPSLKGYWTQYGNATQENRKVPYTQYSNYPDNAFRCVLNEHAP